MRNPRSALLGLWFTVIFECCAGENLASLSDAEKRERIEFLYKDYKTESFPNVKDVHATELAMWLKDGRAVVVDVREPKERAVSTLPGAITREEFERRREEFKDKYVAAYCTIGYRSGLFAKEMAEEGINVFNLNGSVLAWAHSGEPFVDADGNETNRVHVYGRQWNLLPEGYEAEW